jgi:hypothetical protein
MTFSVPWKGPSVIQTSSPYGLLTFLEFPNSGKLIETFASSASISPLVSGALSSYLSGIRESGSGTLVTLQKLYGPQLQSNFDFISSSLYSSPAQLSLDDANILQSLFAAAGLLLVKKNIFSFLKEDLLPVQNVSAIYTILSSSTIDNNAAERALRTVALGRKNYLFAGSDAGGERAAAIYSLIGTAKLNGLDPEFYLRNVLSRIADHPINHIQELLPWNVAAGVQPEMQHVV